jgi:hypothetical protein
MKILKENTLFILDWDDTLFPTNWVIKNNITFQQKNPKLTNIYVWFNKLDKTLSKLLNVLLSMGNVIIITNAMTIWIKISSQFLPLTSRILKHIKVISARDLYESVTSDANIWKIMTFKTEIPKIIKNDFINVISVGDADYEYNALVNFYNYDKYKNKLLKSIKFVKVPTNEQIIEQISILIDAINDITYAPRHLDLVFKSAIV